MSLEEQLALLTKGCVDIVRLDELRERLRQSVETGRRSWSR